MVAAKPTRTWDMDRVRTHKWQAGTCLDCDLVMSDDATLADLPACPGPGFILTQREAPPPSCEHDWVDVQETFVEGRFCRKCNGIAALGSDEVLLDSTPYKQLWEKA